MTQNLILHLLNMETNGIRPDEFQKRDRSLFNAPNW